MCIERPSGKHVVYEVESGELKAAENSRETCRKVWLPTTLRINKKLENLNEKTSKQIPKPLNQAKSNGAVNTWITSKPGRLASDELVAGDLEKSSCVIKNVNKPEKKADD